MFDLDSWQEVWVTITRNKRRSLLTAFGVFWGIFMLVIMLGTGGGLATGIYSQVRGVTENSLMLFTSFTTKPYQGFRKGRYWTMRESDMAALKEHVPGIKMIVPMMSPGNYTVVHGDRSGSYQVKGCEPSYSILMPQIMLYGRYINTLDVQQCRKVCVIGKVLAEELFSPGVNPVGQYVKLFNVNFQVVGVAEPAVSGVNLNGNDDYALILPYTVVQRLFNFGDQVHLLCVISEDGVSTNDLEADIKETLKMRHHIAPDDEAALQSISLEKIFSRFKMLFYGINLLVWIVGAGTLLAGVVGVSNIIMVTVRERTKEIGVRRALGARPSAIMWQIIKESASLTVLAGFVGLLFGVLVLEAVDRLVISPMSGDVFMGCPQIQFTQAVVAVLVLIVCGMAAGILPANRALQIKAIDAIREE